VRGNTACLTQCLANLIDNALKFVPPGRAPEVRVSTKRSGNTVHVAVEDTGIGIPPDRLHEIFEAFQRGRGGFQGTGIGLAIVKKSAERMGGHVIVESEEGKGSRFVVDLEAA
jgi:signal transduction histidine kinase